MDQNIKLESLAATAELSLYHFDFARTFKQSEGTTPHAFVRWVLQIKVILRATRRWHRLWCAGVSRRRFALANSRPKWQSQSRNRVIGWTPV
jgi:hypothetical protein